MLTFAHDRHNHLILYDDLEQIEVRYVISLAHHNVSIHSDERVIPEGELWTKRNAICLTRKPESITAEIETESSTLPFYLFSDNGSEKEDFYFAILKNQEKIPDSPRSPPSPLYFDVKDAITLIRKLHSSEEYLQTRWVNAIMGRIFLALYKTPEFAAFIRNKIEKKIGRVKKPNFVTRLSLRNIHGGEGAPFVTNPRLKDFTVDGDCCIEFDLSYSGNCWLEVAATARIELGARFKPREVDMLLSVALKKLNGHCLLRIKPPPSNRIWFTFEAIPQMEMRIEPIVSSRQITYGVVLRAIESRIREVVAETIVYPFWDDFPILHTENKEFRGGIWEQTNTPKPEPFASVSNASSKASSQEGPNNKDESEKPDEVSVDILTHGSDVFHSDKDAGQASLLTELSHEDEETRNRPLTCDSDKLAGQNKSKAPRIIRKPSVSHAAAPIVTVDNAKANCTTGDTKPDMDAKASVMKASSRSSSNSPSTTPVGSPDSLFSVHDKDSDPGNLTQEPQHAVPEISMPSPPQNAHITPFMSMEQWSRSSLDSSTQSLSSRASPVSQQRQVRDSITSATSMAKKWGLSFIERGKRTKYQDLHAVFPDKPIGQDQPLPPRRGPLPLLGRSSTLPIMSMDIPKRKPVPPSSFEQPSFYAQKPPSSQRSSKALPTFEHHISSLDRTLTVETPTQSEQTIPGCTESAGSFDILDTPNGPHSPSNGGSPQNLARSHVDPFFDVIAHPSEQKPFIP